QTFTFAYQFVGALIDVGTAGFCHQRLHDGDLPCIDTCRLEFANQETIAITVPIYYQAREFIFIADDQRQSLGRTDSFSLGRIDTFVHSSFNTALDQGMIDRLVWIEAPDAGAYLRF